MPLSLSISAQGAIYLGTRSVALDQLESIVGSKRDVVVIRADRKSEHGRVMEVIDELRRLQVGTIFHASDKGPEAW